MSDIVSTARPGPEFAGIAPAAAQADEAGAAAPEEVARAGCVLCPAARTCSSRNIARTQQVCATCCTTSARVDDTGDMVSSKNEK